MEVGSSETVLILLIYKYLLNICDVLSAVSKAQIVTSWFQYNVLLIFICAFDGKSLSDGQSLESFYQSFRIFRQFFFLFFPNKKLMKKWDKTKSV